MTDLINQTTQEITNSIYLSGTILSSFKYDHTCMGEKFYEFELGTMRRSGVMDKTKVIISERLLYFCDKKKGDKIAIEGQIRTHNINHVLKIYVFVQEVYDAIDQDVNEVTVIGHVGKDVVYRETPSGREVTDVMLAVNRRYNKSDYIPCICWGRNARYAGKKLSVGSKVALTGRLQSRDYEKKLPDGEIVKKTATELSVCELHLL